MGASSSGASDKRVTAVTVTTAPSGSYTIPLVTNYCSALPKSSAPLAAPASANNNRYALSESKAPPPPTAPAPAGVVAAPLPPKASNINQVVTFHSAASWRTYFEASKGSNKLILVNFTATWCRPCRYMEPTLNEFAAKYTDVEFVKIDVDELFNVSCEYGIQVMPTFMFIKRGTEVDKVVGVKIEELQNKIEKHRA